MHLSGEPAEGAAEPLIALKMEFLPRWPDGVRRSDSPERIVTAVAGQISFRS